MSTVYLIHFAKKLHHAQHYIGYTDQEKLSDRYRRHKEKRGAKILAECVRRNIFFFVTRTWNADRSLERKLKNQKNAKRLCPVCKKKGKKNE